MKRILIFILIISASNICSQEINFAKHSIVLEIGGPGLVYSLNYQYQLNDKWAIRSGLGFLNIKEKNTNKELTYLAIPVEIRRTLSISNDHKNQLNIGIGIQQIIGSGNIISNRNETDIFLNPMLNIGYQYNFDSNYFLQANFTPFYGTKSLTNDSGFFELYNPLVIDGTTIHLWGGIAFGYRFDK